MAIGTKKMLEKLLRIMESRDEEGKYNLCIYLFNNYLHFCFTSYPRLNAFQTRH